MASPKFVNWITNQPVAMDNFPDTIAINPPAGTEQGITVTQTMTGTVTTPGFNYNFISVTDELSTGGNTAYAFSVFEGLASSSVDSARGAILGTIFLTQPTSSGNPNRDYVAGTFWANATSSDGGGAGTEKGAMFGMNPIATLEASAIHMVGLVGGEVNVLAVAGSSVLQKYGWSIVQLAADAVSGSVNDAAINITNQSGSVGWDNGIQFGDGTNQFPVKGTGTLIKTNGTASTATGIDFSSASFSTAAISSKNFTVHGDGGDSAILALFNGSSHGLRFGAGASNFAIEGVDNTGVGSFQPLVLNASFLLFQTNGGTQALELDTGQNAIFAGWIKPLVTVVGSLPSAATAGQGAKAFVTDATVTTFASIVAGSGANKVPVYSDGTNWRIG